jgi:hypothetical protein
MCGCAVKIFKPCISETALFTAKETSSMLRIMFAHYTMPVNTLKSAEIG